MPCGRAFDQSVDCAEIFPTLAPPGRPSFLPGGRHSMTGVNLRTRDTLQRRITAAARVRDDLAQTVLLRRITAECATCPRSDDCDACPLVAWSPRR